MREQIDIMDALRLYEELQNWREVSKHLVRKNGMRFSHDGVQAAVRRHDREPS